MHHNLAIICMQLRSAVLDISDELPETDDYFFLRWLRGEQNINKSRSDDGYLILGHNLAAVF